MSKQNPGYPGQYPEKSDFADSPPAYQDPGMAGYQTSYPGPQQYVAYPPGQGPYPPAQPYPSPQGQYPMGQGPAVTMQPAIYVQRAPLVHPMPDYLGYSIFTMLCCCLPLGIAALIYSISTRDANNMGNEELAKKNSRLARNLNHTGLGIGIAILILWIAYVAFAASHH
ncbi:calcium-binding protein P-like [Acipenser ruthenus]|uniref:calcium-binding protein P-like n=1 Tax=Acipenser ruthenus TaxID=7906 RepID=UPI00145AAE7E|nr:calcium-binding protein P-like [Acipenser ruthenus]XP_058866776.1 calcium-binding protein P-like [Acipenser ruthenus]